MLVILIAGGVLLGGLALWTVIKAGRAFNALDRAPSEPPTPWPSWRYWLGVLVFLALDFLFLTLPHH